MAKEPFGYSIFADDCREEVGGKYSLIGIYKADLIVQGKLPVKLPKFCIATTVTVPARMQIFPMTMKVFLPQDEDAASISMEVASGAPHKVSEDPTDDKVNSLQSILMLGDVMLNKSGLIRVRAYLRGDTEVKCGTLRISATEPSDAPAQDPLL